MLHINLNHITYIILYYIYICGSPNSRADVPAIHDRWCLEAKKQFPNVKLYTKSCKIQVHGFAKSVPVSNGDMLAAAALADAYGRAAERFWAHLDVKTKTFAIQLVYNVFGFHTGLSTGPWYA